MITPFAHDCREIINHSKLFERITRFIPESITEAASRLALS